MNKGASIRQKLLNISKSKEENVTFQTIIVRYLHERLLFRLSQSEYKNHFFLKGGALIYALDNKITRPTKDLDLLGQSVPGDLESVKTIFQEICSINDNDAVTFLAETITVEPIKEEDKYEGVRLHIDGKFDSIKQRLQVDIGFGDVIFPEPQIIHYPLLLSENSPVELKTYTIESIIAEKVHAMVVLGLANSRMKDFYDGNSRLYLIRKKEIKQLTEDHSYVAELVKAGIVSEQEATNHPRKNEITRAIGIRSKVQPDVCQAPIPLQKGDCILLCSDGLTNMVNDETICEIVNDSQTIQQKVQHLIDKANAVGGKDNSTVTLIEMKTIPFWKRWLYHSLHVANPFFWKLFGFSTGFSLCSIKKLRFTSGNTNSINLPERLMVIRFSSSSK
jgi:predicted nucleotidyltransferase component of viral defense system